MVIGNASFVLRSASASLVVTPVDPSRNDWSQIELHQGSTIRPLGAASIAYLLTYLGNFLRVPSPQERWIATISERHTTLYGAHIDEGVVIRLQDAEAQFFATITLTSGEVREWMHELSQHASESVAEKTMPGPRQRR